MEDALVSPWVLAGLFFLVALAYSSVGLGGGSSYAALLSIFAVSHVVIPTVSLLLNIIVTAVGSVLYGKQRHLRFHLVLPFLATSIPMSFVGGALDVPKTVFRWVLLVSLVLVALRIYVWKDLAANLRLGPRARVGVSLALGAVLGLVGGIVGIGGGIYLVPLVIFLGLGTEKEAAACGAVFILVNSIAALAARLSFHPVPLGPILPLGVAVLAGGLIGAHLGSAKLAPRTMQRVLGGIVVVAVLLLARRLLWP